MIQEPRKTCECEANPLSLTTMFDPLYRPGRFLLSWAALHEGCPPGSQQIIGNTPLSSESLSIYSPFLSASKGLAWSLEVRAQVTLSSPPLDILLFLQACIPTAPSLHPACLPFLLGSLHLLSYFPHTAQTLWIRKIPYVCGWNLIEYDRCSSSIQFLIYDGGCECSLSFPIFLSFLFVWLIGERKCSQKSTHSLSY